MKIFFNKIIFLSLTVLFFNILLGNAQSLKWAKQMGSFLDIGTSIVLDDSGNVYTTGFFWGTSDFDPGPATYNLISVGPPIPIQRDVFVSKLDAAGNFVWAKQFGGTGDNRGKSIAIDTFGNVYITGYFQNTVDFDPGAATFNLTSFGSDDIFVSKLDAAGNFVWAKQMGGTNSDKGRSIAVDDAGNVYTTGFFWGTADFDPSGSTFNLTATSGGDVFISKLDAAGNFVWAKQMEGTGGSGGYSITLDASGNIYTTGIFMDTADFDPGVGVSNLVSAGNFDAFISKLDAAGNFIWAKRIGGTGWEQGYSIAVDASENVYTTGFFEDTVDFDPGADSLELISVGKQDIFISKLDVLGNFVWAKSMGGTNDEYGSSILLGNSDNIIYLMGDQYSTTVDYDPSTGIYNISKISGNEANFIARYDSSGKLLCAFAITPGHNETDADRHIAIDEMGDIYVTAATDDPTIDFDPCTGVTNLPNSTGYAIYVAKYAFDTDTADFIWTNDTVCVGGSTSFMENSSSSCSLDSLAWNFGDPASGVANTSNLQTPSHIFTSAGIYNVELIMYWPCGKDTITYPLTIVNTPAPISYVNDSICQGDSILLGGAFQNTAGIYNDTISGVAGCDSIISTTLVINTPPILSIQATDTSIQSGDNVLITVFPTGLKYSWKPIIGLNNPTTNTPVASPEQTTNYMVTVTDNNGCNSDIMVLIIVEEPESIIWLPTVFSPNGDGVNDRFIARAVPANTQGVERFILRIFDRWGKKVFEQTGTPSSEIQWNGLYKGKQLNTGVYVWHIEAKLAKGVAETIFMKGNVTLIN